jgi:hypothetical protein
MGAPVLAAACAGAWISARRDIRLTAIFLAFPLAYYAAAGPGKTVFVRYMLPLVPFVAIAAAVAVDAVVATLAGWRRFGPRSTNLAAAAIAGVLIAPSAIALARLDYYLGRTDNRLLAGRWLVARAESGATIYQTGAPYGALQFPRESRLAEWSFDENTGEFQSAGRPTGGEPDWIVVQRSAVTLYSRVPDRITMLLSTGRYQRVRSFEAADLSASNVFDQQDAFFLPLSGFEGISRPGPNFDVYQRVRRSAAR